MSQIHLNHGLSSVGIRFDDVVRIAHTKYKCVCPSAPSWCGIINQSRNRAIHFFFENHETTTDHFTDNLCNYRPSPASLGHYDIDYNSPRKFSQR